MSPGSDGTCADGAAWPGASSAVRRDFSKRETASSSGDGWSGTGRHDYERHSCIVHISACGDRLLVARVPRNDAWDERRDGDVLVVAASIPEGTARDSRLILDPAVPSPRKTGRTRKVPADAAPSRRSP